MIKKNPRFPSGFSIVELMVYVGIAGIVALGATNLLSGITERRLRSEADSAVASLNAMLIKTANKSFQTLTTSKFDNANTFRYENLNWDGRFLNLNRYDSDLLIDWTADAQKQLFIEAIKKETINNPFQEAALAYIGSSPGFKAGSFELFFENVEQGETPGSVTFDNSSLLIARCINEGKLLKDGSRYSVDAPVSSMLYLLSIQEKPFIFKNPVGGWVVRCLKSSEITISSSKNKAPTDRDSEFKELSKWRPTVFMLKLNADLIPKSITELNAASEISPNFGAGFMLTFNEAIRTGTVTNQVGGRNVTKTIPEPYAPPVTLHSFVIYDKCLGTSLSRRPSSEMESCIRLEPTSKSTNEDVNGKGMISNYLSQALDIQNNSLQGTLNVDDRQGTSFILGPGRKVSE